MGTDSREEKKVYGHQIKEKENYEKKKVKARVWRLTQTK